MASPRTPRLARLTLRTRPRPIVVAASAARRAVVVAAASGTAPSLQLATARLPDGTNRDVFVQAIYQWASTLTTHGRNLPFSLPLDCRPSPTGFSIALLRVAKGGAVLPVADVVAAVERVDDADVLFVRLFEGEAAAELGLAGRSTDPDTRLDTLLSACVDVPLILQTMPEAIRKAVIVAR